MKKTNKILAIILAILMVVSITPITASAAITGTAGKDITWELDSSTGTLTFSGSGEMYGYYGDGSTPPWDYESKVKTVIIEEGITTIGSRAFIGFYNLTNVTIPNSVTIIDDNAFYKCTKLTNIIIPEGVRQIGEYAFSNCSNLTSITLPESLLWIDTDAFAKCTALTDVNYLGTLEDWYGIGIAEGNGNLYVVDITSLPSKNFTWEFDEETATLTITGSGEIVDFRYEDDWGGYYCGTRPWEDIIENDVKHVVINEGITSIGAYAFAYSNSLETVTMSSVKTISTDAFCSCVNLKAVTTSNSLKVIGDDAFYKCDKLTYIYYSGTQNEWDHVKIGDHWNDEMDTVKVYPSDYVVYSDYGNGVILIADDTITWVFDANSYTLTVSGEGDTFDDYMVDEKFHSKTCYKFFGYRGWDYYKYDTKKIVVDNGINYIGNNSFRFFLNATDVVIPLSVTEIGKMAFRTCDSITDVYYAGTEVQWKNIVIGTDNDALLNANIHYNYVECEHNYETTVVTEPTCINRGYTTHICSKCNESYVDSFLEFTECPDYVEVIWPPTCTEQGYIAHECPICHTGYVEKYLDPTHKYEQTSVTQPTCTTQGYTTYTCTACGKVAKDDYTSSLGHDYGDAIEISAPTCTEKGYTKQICARCEYEFISNKVPALGHDYIEVSTIAPTCTEQGYTTYVCSVCGAESMDNYIEATGHNCEEWTTVVEPQCGVKGKEKAVCTVCEEEIEQDISSLSHDYGELEIDYDATCTETGRMAQKCSRCESKTGFKTIPAKGHTYGEWVVITPATCQTYGLMRRQCLYCDTNESVSAIGEHDYSIEHNVVEATCITDGSKTVECSLCGDTKNEVTPATGHSYTTEITTPATHTQTGIETFTCACGDTYTEVIEKLEKHNYESVVTAPTCTEQGYTTYTCGCGNSYVVDYIDATGHISADAVEENYVAPTCTETGSKDVVVYCSICDAEISRETKTIEEAEHTVVTYEKITLAPTCTENGAKEIAHCCTECNTVISKENVTIDATGHADNDNDGYCDADNEILDPSVECECNCHKTGVSNFFFKLILFFQKIFGSNNVCDCGVSHY